VHGRVIGRTRNTMQIEIPADLISGAVTLFGMGGFSATLGKQNTRLAERRIVNMQGDTVVCPGDLGDNRVLRVLSVRRRSATALRCRRSAAARGCSRHHPASAATQRVNP
jgi:hypothetical protein